MVAERKLFGTDGVRGIANRYPMTSEVALALGRAAAHVLRRDQRRHAVVIGKDTRLSGYMLETALASGVCSMGVNVMLVGPLPTPGVAFITRQMRADFGVMISASHNPYRDNGIKFFDRAGYKLSDEIENEMEQAIDCGELAAIRPTAEDIGKAVRIDDAAGRYITFLKSTVPTGITFEGLKIVLDCAHGAAYRIAPAVFSELGAHVITMGVNPDGRNINQGCGSLHPESMAAVVRERGADCGCAFDGDADRIIMCDAQGHLIDGDTILALCARDMLQRGVLPQKTVVATTMSNIGLDLALQQLGIRLVRSDVGDRYVLQAMREAGCNLGGEQSGHIIFSDFNTTGDGVLGALQVVTLMCREGKPLSTLREILTPLPQIMTNVRVREKRPLADVATVTRLITQFERELGGRGRIVVRYSGTEALARVMVEGESGDRIRTIADTIAGEIATQLGE
ncbi:MAG: phosphoglucosamine mutase [Deltaproteobacteria bacterium]|nr:phosphoglucosamine mutase [Deltaproteobacteria bacterium]